MKIWTAKVRWIAAGLATWLVSGLSTLLAQQKPPDVFVPADQVAREALPAAPLIFIAYAVVWAAVLMYVFVLWRRLMRVERELADVTRRLEARAGKRP